MGDRVIREQVAEWMGEMRRTASAQPGTGACAVATAMSLWAYVFDRLARARGEGQADVAQASPALADALGLLLASRALVLHAASAGDPFVSDLCHAQVARACGEVGRLCAEIMFGTQRHPAWDLDTQACYRAEDLQMIEEYLPGLTSCARAYADVLETDGSHPAKAGPCVKFDGMEEFVQLRTRLDACLAGATLARGRAARKILGTDQG
jgi:hypothetical protein